MVVKKAITSGCYDVMCCIATSVSDMELIGLGPWSGVSTASLYCLATGAPGTANSCTFR